MRPTLTPIQFSDGTNGKLTISPHVSASEKLQSWVLNKEYAAFVDEEYRMHRHTRKRNKLYSFTHPLLEKEVILKVSIIDKQYKLMRRINLIFSTLFNDYNLRAFNGALLLRQIDIDCPEPILYWFESNSVFTKKSFYMYEKVQAEHSLFSFTELLSRDDYIRSQEIYKQLAEKTVNIIKRIHEAGFRQGDPHPGNFLVTTSDQYSVDTNQINMKNIQMHIIDLDKFSIAKPFGKTIKRFFDLRCMRRCTLGPFNQTDMLKLYLKDDYSRTWNMVVQFWMRGGFNPYKWFKKPKKGR